MGETRVINAELRGIGVARGIAIGRAHLLAPSELEIKQYNVQRADVLHEVARLNNAFSLVRAELEELRSTVSADAPGEVKAFLDLHRMILDDSLLCDAPRDLVRSRLINAEWALTIQLEELCRQFDAIDDEYFSSRSLDVRQVVERVLRRLAGGGPAVAMLPRQLEEGERLVLVAGDLVVLDSDGGRLIVNPDSALLETYRQRIQEEGLRRTELRKLKGRIARTADGIPVQLLANIEMPEDARDALEAGADGVGLFRSEFLFMNRDQLPSEDEQFEAYAKVARSMKGKPVVIRTLDIGADKVLTSSARLSLGMLPGDGIEEPNPALGLRAIRYCLAYPELFLTQLRAILRASSQGTVRILVPMLAPVHEIEEAMAFVARAKEQLKDRRQKFDARVAVGGMIEVPAAALTLPAFVSRLKFLSIGTNDLIQYTLAIDRNDSAVAHLYDHLHPAVLQLIHRTIRTGEKARVPVSVCGEMAGDVVLAELLLGMGLRQFSMNPSQLLTVKQRVFELSTRTAARLAARVLRSHDPIEIRRAIERGSANGRAAPRPPLPVAPALAQLSP